MAVIFYILYTFFCPLVCPISYYAGNLIHRGVSGPLKKTVTLHIRIIMEAELPLSISEAFVVLEMGHGPLPKNVINF